jgi:hypothetical protein
MLRLHHVPGRPGYLYLSTADGEDLPSSWMVEARRADGSAIGTERQGARLTLSEPARLGELLLVTVLQQGPGGSAFVRHPVRLLVPEATMNDPAVPAVPADRDVTLRRQAIPVLDFGTHGQCAALWDITGRKARGQLVPSQTAALSAVIGMAVSEDPDDAEVRAAHAYADGEVVDRRAQAWNEVFAAPPLEHYAIREVIQPRTLTLGADRSLGLGYRGLKRDLLKRSHDEESLQSLVTAYREMGEEALGSLRNDFGKPLMPFEMQFTYPTRLPAAQRNRLQHLLQATSLPKPRLYLDEATAVAFFDLLTRIGQRSSLGLAALRTRAGAGETGRDINDRVLVIDVGAGTTDVALIDMRILDLTPDAARTVPGHGSYWMIFPSVQAAGGALTFGADGLTLDLFGRLKQRLAERGAAVATEWRQDPSRWADFVALWQVAEQTKHRVLGPDVGRNVDVEVVFPGGRVVVVPLRWQSDVAPRAEEFLRRVTKLAAGIAKAGLAHAAESGTPGRTPRVDRVVLSGTSFLSEYLRERLEQVLRAAFKEEDGLNDDFALVAHLRYLKSAAALGAAALASVRDNESHPEHQLVIRDLRNGLDKFGVRDGDMRANLAAEFQTYGSGLVSTATTVFPHGAQLSRYAASGGSPDHRRFARSGAHTIWPTIQIVRRDAADVRTSLVGSERYDRDSFIDWGYFRIEGLDELTRTRPDLDDARRRTSAVYEIDENENVTMYLYLDDAPPLDLGSGEAIGALPPGAIAVGELASDVHLNAGNLLQELGAPLLPAGTALPAVASASAARRRITLTVQVKPEENPHAVTVHSADHTWVSIDIDGTVRSHPLEPPILAVDHDGTIGATTSFLEQALQDRPAAHRWASRLTIEPAGQYDEELDPFSGIH